MRTLILLAGGFLFAGVTNAQTVQLPSFQYFTYSGSVLVPDRGGTSLGSIRRSSSGRASRGFGGRAFGNRAAGGMNSASGASVHATIIDLDAMDRQIRGIQPASAVRQTTRGRDAGDARVESRKPDPDAEGKALVRYARSLYRKGNKSLSFDAYQLAMTKLNPKLAALAKAEMERVFSANERIAMSR